MIVEYCLTFPPYIICLSHLTLLYLIYFLYLPLLYIIYRFYLTLLYFIYLSYLTLPYLIYLIYIALLYLIYLPYLMFLYLTRLYCAQQNCLNYFTSYFLFFIFFCLISNYLLCILFRVCFRTVRLRLSSGPTIGSWSGFVTSTSLNTLLTFVAAAFTGLSWSAPALVNILRLIKYFIHLSISSIVCMTSL